MQTFSKDTVSDTYLAFIDHVSAHFLATLDQISDLVSALAASHCQQDLDSKERDLHIAVKLNAESSLNPEIFAFERSEKGLVSITGSDLDYLIAADASFANYVSRLIAERLIKSAIEHGVFTDQSNPVIPHSI